jgi:hypothetical protein
VLPPVLVALIHATTLELLREAKQKRLLVQPMRRLHDNSQPSLRAADIETDAGPRLKSAGTRSHHCARQISDASKSDSPFEA